MILFDSIKNSLRIIIKTPAIALFFVLFLIAINFLGAYTMRSANPIVFNVLMFCTFAFLCVFIAGWFQVIKESLNIEKIKEKNFYSIFPEGIGMNSILCAFGVLVYFLLFIGFVMLAKELAHYIFGSIDFLVKDLAGVAANNDAMVNYFSSLSTDKKYIIYGWQMMFIGVISIFNLLFLFFFPILLDNKKEENVFIKPLKSIYRSVFFALKNFFAVFSILILIHFTNIVLALLNAICAKNPILSVLILFIYIYFVAFTIVLIFNYYDAKTNFKKEDNSDRGSDSIGENAAITETSESDQ